MLRPGDESYPEMSQEAEIREDDTGSSLRCLLPLHRCLSLANPDSGPFLALNLQWLPITYRMKSEFLGLVQKALPSLTLA